MMLVELSSLERHLKNNCSHENLNVCFRKKFHLSCFSFDHCSFKDVAKKKHFVGEIDSLENQVALYLESEYRRFV